MVELQNVSVTYSSGVDALNDVSLKINDGDFAFVVGSSGAGKSTMIKLLLKEINATSGMVSVNGYNLNTLKKRKIPEFRRTLGFVFQDFRLIQSMTVYDNIAFVLRVIDTPTKEIKKRVPYVIDLVGLTAKTNSYPNELSGGEMQRVAIARALVNDPQLIIADEPTGNIDPELSYEIVGLLKSINDQGTTILMVTHEHDLVRHFGGRIININEGRIVFDDVILGSADGIPIENEFTQNDVISTEKDYNSEEEYVYTSEDTEESNLSPEDLFIPEDIQDDIRESIEEDLNEGYIPSEEPIYNYENDIQENSNEEKRLTSTEELFVDELVALLNGEDELSLLLGESEASVNSGNGVGSDEV